jgi:UDP-glucose 4-epimerase
MTPPQGRVIVTGAAGKLGRAVSASLHAAGHAVTGIDLRIPEESPVPIRVGNLLDREAAYGLLESGDTLVHLANHPNFSLGDAQRVFNENVAMDMNVFQAALELGFRKIVFSSSIQVFSGEGDRCGVARFKLPYLPADSDYAPRPGNPYALSKQAGEMLLAYFVERGIAEAVAVRFPYLLSREDAEERLARPMRRPGRGRTNELYSFLTLPDAGSLVRAIMATTLPGFRTYFVAARANSRGTTAAELVASEYADVPLRGNPSDWTGLTDLSRVTAETGWEPTC